MSNPVKMLNVIHTASHINLVKNDGFRLLNSGTIGD